LTGILCIDIISFLLLTIVPGEKIMAKEATSAPIGDSEVSAPPQKNVFVLFGDLPPGKSQVPAPFG
jgi:hypothetical protein